MAVMETTVSEHLALEEVDAFIERNLPSVRRKEILRHLFQGCTHCQATAIQRVQPAPWSPAEEAHFDEILESAIAEALRAERRREDQEAKQEAAALLAKGGMTTLLEEGDIPLRGLGLYEALSERSWALRHDNPKEMVALARAMINIAEDLDPQFYGPEKVVALRARAWGELGNALRVTDALWEAQLAFGEAFNLLNNGVDDLLLKARLHDYHASLLGTQRKFGLAFAALDVAHALYGEMGDLHFAGRVLIKKAIFLHRSGQPEQALELSREGRQQIDETREPGLTAWALHNELLFLSACDRNKEARNLLFQSRARLANSGRVNQLKLSWAESRINLALEDLDKAEKGFLQVWEGFRQTGQQFAAALSGVELALVWMRQGQVDKAEAVVLEAFGIFRALSIHREVLGAVQLLRDAFYVKKASVALIESVVSFLKEWEINPDARFLPSNE